MTYLSDRGNHRAFPSVIVPVLRRCLALVWLVVALTRCQQASNTARPRTRTTSTTGDPSFCTRHNPDGTISRVEVDSVPGRHPRACDLLPGGTPGLR